MKAKNIVVIILWVWIAWRSLLPAITFASPASVEAPPGFRLIASQQGVGMYRKDYPGGTPDFVQVINLRQGARVVLLHGEISNPRSGKGAYGGDDPSIGSQSLQSYWRELKQDYDNLFCVTNGQFFLMRESPTRLPFPLKVNGKIVTDGYGIKEFPDQKLMLEIWPDRVNIRPLNKNALYTSTAPNIMGGLNEEAHKRIDHYVGRTFVGIADDNHDGRHEIILIFNTLSARQKDAAKVLYSFGADQVMMLDGGGSTQLLCKQQAYIESERLIPQAIGVLSGEGVHLAAQVDPLSSLPSRSEAPGSALSQVGSPDASSGSGQANHETQLASQAELDQAMLDLRDMAWVPIIILPICLFLFLVIKGRFSEM